MNKQKKEKINRGQPTKFKKEFVNQAFKLCQLGATDALLADFFNVTQRTINNWKKSHLDFFHTLKTAKAEFDTKVEMALFQRAIGFSHPEEKIFNNQGKIIKVPTVKYYPPDTTACIFWLKNRKPQQWRDKVEQEQSGEMVIKVVRK